MTTPDQPTTRSSVPVWSPSEIEISYTGGALVDHSVVEGELLDDSVVEPETLRAEVEPGPKPRWLGALGVLLAVITIVLHIVAVVVATGGDVPTSTVLTWIAIVFSGVTVVTGLVAAIFGRGRAWGIAAVILGIAANPYLLLVTLRFFSE